MIESVMEREIAWGDLDALGIVFYPRYYEWIDAAGHLFFKTIQLNLYELWEKRNIQFGLAETSCRYIKPGRYGLKIKIKTSLEELKKKTVLLRHEIYQAADDEKMVEGFEKRICINVADIKNFNSINIPQDLFAIFEKAKRD
jgi:YbgC/YbaW family acyl-CoA thioester hydrolase